jgi:bifunctional enzyme CysN/CysC
VSKKPKAETKSKPSLRLVESARELMRIVIVGHVDHGKSTLVGRLFYETDSLPDGKFEAIRDMCEKRGVPFEWAFLMDAFQAERDQGITIDTSQIWFDTEKRDYTIIDAPGHREFVKNMVTGAAQADAAVLVIDALEGVRQQSRRHGYLLHLMGVSQVAVVVNKMDVVDYDQARFGEIEREYRAYLASIGVEPTHVIPVSARDGEGLTKKSAKMPWYRGATVTEALDGFALAAKPLEQPFRLPVQDVYKFDDRRIIAGQIASGMVSVGDEIMFSPSNKTARIASIEHWSAVSGKTETRTEAGRSVGVTLDEQIFVERGEVMSAIKDLPIETDVFRARIFWLGHEPIKPGNRYKMKLNTLEASVRVDRIERVIDTDDLSGKPSSKVARHQVAEVVLRARKVLAVDEFEQMRRTGRFVLVDGYDIAGGGIISMDGYADQRDLITMRSTNVTRVDHGVARDERERTNGHRGGVIWLTGLSGSGKSTLATRLERRLFQKGYQSFVLDGDNVRHGLNANLGFSPEDRAENIRRISEVAALYSRAGMIAIASFISPYRSDRNRARQAAAGSFHEIHVKADLETCEMRDPKGLYKKARAGEIEEFTGISAPYEPPEEPELVIDTTERTVEDCLEELVAYVETHFGLTGQAREISDYQI